MKEPKILIKDMFTFEIPDGISFTDLREKMADIEMMAGQKTVGDYHIERIYMDQDGQYTTVVTFMRWETDEEQKARLDHAEKIRKRKEVAKLQNN